MTHTVMDECRLANLREVDDYQNGEKVGKKTVVDVVTWGEKVPVRVDPSYSKEIKMGVTGKATVVSELFEIKYINNFNDKKTGKDSQYIKEGVYFRAVSLLGFEIGNSK